jgi:hypothetical protein
VIRAQRPKHLYVIADGPKAECAEDMKNVELTRGVIEHNWDGSLTLDYSDTNLGCQRRIVSGLNAVFERVERAIILEDDCVPHVDFFLFCETLLEQYADVPEVLHITGTNFLDSRLFQNSHAMTQYPTPWGWATWRRSWKRIDLSMRIFFDNEEKIKTRRTVSRRAWEKLVRRLRKVSAGQLDSWAYPWLATCLALEGLVATPKTNLVSNIGFDRRSTHTSNPRSYFANFPRKALEEPIQAQENPGLDPKINRELFDLLFAGGYRKKSWLRRYFRA